MFEIILIILGLPLLMFLLGFPLVIIIYNHYIKAEVEPLIIKLMRPQTKEIYKKNLAIEVHPYKNPIIAEHKYDYTDFDELLKERGKTDVEDQIAFLKDLIGVHPNNIAVFGMDKIPDDELCLELKELFIDSTWRKLKAYSEDES